VGFVIFVLNIYLHTGIDKVLLFTKKKLFLLSHSPKSHRDEKRSPSMDAVTNGNGGSEIEKENTLGF